MKKTPFTFLAALAMISVGFSSGAFAQAQRTFVSAENGNDANNCSRLAPCRNFAQAILQTSPGGEIIVLDSGGYGTVTISSPISIISPPGVYAGVTAFSANAISVNAAPTDEVVLRGLTLQGLGGTTGVQFTGGNALFVENGLVNGFSNSGINVTLSGTGQAFITDTIVRNGGLHGVVVFASSGIASATLDNVRLENNGPGALGVGLLASAGSRVIVRGSVSSGNDVQFRANVTSGGASVLDIESCLAIGNGGTGTGIHALATGGTAMVRVSNSTITNNANGVVVGAGGTVVSRTNNTLEGNTGGNTVATFAAK